MSRYDEKLPQLRGRSGNCSIHSKGDSEVRIERHLDNVIPPPWISEKGERNTSFFWFYFDVITRALLRRNLMEGFIVIKCGCLIGCVRNFQDLCPRRFPGPVIMVQSTDWCDIKLSWVNTVISLWFPGDDLLFLTVSFALDNYSVSGWVKDMW